MSGRECICPNIALVKFDTRQEVPSSIEYPRTYVRTYVRISRLLPLLLPLFFIRSRVRIPNDGIIPSWRWYRD